MRRLLSMTENDFEFKTMERANKNILATQLFS